MDGHYYLDVEICSDAGRVAITPVAHGAREHVGRFHRPPDKLRVGETIELRLVGRQLGSGRVDLTCRLIALYHDDVWRNFEVGAGFRVSVIKAMQRGRRRAPHEIFGDAGSGTIPHFDGVIGNLELMSIADLLQSLSVSGRVARVELQSERGVRGSIWTEQGRVRHASLEALEGVEAFFALLGIERGMFRLQHESRAPQATIDAPVAQLLLEGMRRFDESCREDELDETDPSLRFNLSHSDESVPLPC